MTTKILIACLILTLVSLTLSQSTSSTELSALHDFKDATGHNNWISSQRNGELAYDTTWTNNGNVCDFDDHWFGVICDSSNHIRVLLLASNNVVGTIPSTFVNLGWLEQLYLFDNGISGSLPNNFNNLGALTHLYLWDNSMTSVLNVANTNNLEKFYFERNSVADTNFNWISTLPNLLEVDASDNSITGTLPNNIQSATSLRKINFNNNGLTGTIPRQLLEHPEMIFVYLNNNQLTGPIPNNIDIAGLGLRLNNLDFGNNNLRCLIPDWIIDVDFPVDLRENEFYCPVPVSTFNMLTTPSTCVQIAQTDATPDTYEIFGDVGTSITITATNLNPDCSSEPFECKFKDVSGGAFLTTTATAQTATTVTCPFPDFAVGGAKTVCLSKDGVELATDCSDIYTYYDCSTLCQNGGYCNQITGECICNYLWTGDFCELRDCGGCGEDATDTFGNPEPHGYCNTTDGKCICNTGFHGTHCEKGNKLCNNTCENGGFCNEYEGVCVCTLGWEGPNCTDIFCPECDPRGGVCVNGLCECFDDWNGVLCNVPNATCPGDGFCGSNLASPTGRCDKVSGICQCYPGWEGEVCDKRRCPNNCTFPNGDCDTATGLCTCNGFYQLPTCVVQRIPCPNDCTSVDNGVCNYQTGECSCRSPFTTADCSVGICTPADCSGNGRCDNTTGICDCDWPFIGRSCVTPNATCPNDCSGVGSCNVFTGECICPAGSDPAVLDCSVKLCPGDGSCSGNGVCDSVTGTCECELNYQGATCNTPDFDCPENCNANGFCNRREGVCYCYGGFTGASCIARTCNNNCTGNGDCDPNTGNCICDDGFEGDDCSLLSCERECINNGQCNKFIGACECAAGFSGENCALLACPNDCSGKGTCVGGVCFCVERFIEDDCSVQEPDYPLIALVIILAVLGGLVLIAVIFLIWRQVMIAQLSAQIANGGTEGVDLDAISDSA